jgi:hypothetical protein
MTDDDRIVLKIVTGDENWCFMYDPEAKCQECSFVESKETESSESEKAKLAGQINADCIA